MAPSSQVPPPRTAQPQKYLILDNNSTAVSIIYTIRIMLIARVIKQAICQLNRNYLKQRKANDEPITAIV